MTGPHALVYARVDCTTGFATAWLAGAAWLVCVVGAALGAACSGGCRRDPCGRDGHSAVLLLAPAAPLPLPLQLAEARATGERECRHSHLVRQAHHQPTRARVPPLQEVLPERSCLLRKGHLSEVLCKPKIMPIKSLTLEKIEDMEAQAARGRPFRALPSASSSRRKHCVVGVSFCECRVSCV